MMISRRDVLRHGGAISLGLIGLRRHVLAPLEPTTGPDLGPLVDDPRSVLSLPEGFQYTIISRIGETMDDGLLVPALHDGMATFPGLGGLTVLVRNHEVAAGTPELGAFGPNNELLGRVDRARVYDIGHGEYPSLGGTTTLLFDTATQELKSHYLSLAGTMINCAGGPTPWGSWISCEETSQVSGAEFEKDHGYNFEVPANARGLVEPIPLKAMGRFTHEAVAVDPRTGIVYETEDRYEGLLYRFIPDEPGQLTKGRLQALAFLDLESIDTRNWLDEDGRVPNRIGVGKKSRVRWIDLDGIDSREDDLRLRGFESGAACFARGEGAWFDGRHLYIACTNGGPNGTGQIWRYTPGRGEGTVDEIPGSLELFIESEQAELLENCDNLTGTPWGDLLVCEDSAGADRIVGITPRGELYTLAENVLSDSELAGATFSPDGTTLFVNIQHSGLTLAITGPWPRPRR